MFGWIGLHVCVGVVGTRHNSVHKKWNDKIQPIPSGDRSTSTTEASHARTHSHTHLTSLSHPHRTSKHDVRTDFVELTNINRNEASARVESFTKNNNLIKFQFPSKGDVLCTHTIYAYRLDICSAYLDLTKRAHNMLSGSIECSNNNEHDTCIIGKTQSTARTRYSHVRIMQNTEPKHN